MTFEQPRKLKRDKSEFIKKKKQDLGKIRFQVKKNEISDQIRSREVRTILY